MIEADFQRELAKGLRSQGCFVTKIPDTAVAVVKPFDLVVGYDSMFFCLECKLKKIRRKKPLSEEDTLVSLKDFRPHQLPTLREILDKGQGYPYIAAGIIREYEGRVVEKRAWIISVQYFGEKFTCWKIGGMIEDWEMIWKPGIGWLCPWLSPAVADLQAELVELSAQLVNP